MLVKAVNVMVYGAVILSLFAIDYMLGHGFMDMSHRIFCKIMCFVKRTVKEEQAVPDVPISIPVLLVEVLVLSITIAFLNKYKQSRNRDPIDALLNESKEALRQTNEFLEKWRLRRVPNEYSYLDDEPQEINPLKLEVPILHMAIIDALSTTRSKPERGDAGDTVNITDSTLLSVTSFFDDDFESVTEPMLEEKLSDETKNIDIRNRYLWAVMEEDSNVLDD